MPHARAPPAHLAAALQALRELARRVEQLCAFLALVADGARRAGIERAHIVQDLLLRLQGSYQLSFDSQAGTDSIPMHQVGA